MWDHLGGGWGGRLSCFLLETTWSTCTPSVCFCMWLARTTRLCFLSIFCTCSCMLSEYRCVHCQAYWVPDWPQFHLHLGSSTVVPLFCCKYILCQRTIFTMSLVYFFLGPNSWNCSCLCVHFVTCGVSWSMLSVKHTSRTWNWCSPALSMVWCFEMK